MQLCYKHDIHHILKAKRSQTSETKALPVNFSLQSPSTENLLQLNPDHNKQRNITNKRLNPKSK